MAGSRQEARASCVPSMALVLELRRSRETQGEQNYCHDKMYWEQVGGTGTLGTDHYSPWKLAKV